MIFRLLNRLADALGWHSADEMSDFFACGISVLPIMLIAEGHAAAAGVALIMLICALITCSMLAGSDPQEFDADLRRKKDKPPPRHD
jgi:hypothetical protein